MPHDDEFFGIEDYERQIEEDKSRYADCGDGPDWSDWCDDDDNDDDDDDEEEDFDDEEKFDLV
jgi:hypothetical protein